MDENKQLLGWKKLIDDLINLDSLIDRKEFSLKLIDNEFWVESDRLREKIKLCKSLIDAYKQLKIEICKQLKFKVESEINYLQCLGHDKLQDTNTNTDAKCHGTLESSSQEKQPTIQCCRSKY